jgi:hypothetical protein
MYSLAHTFRNPELANWPRSRRESVHAWKARRKKIHRWRSRRVSESSSTRPCRARAATSRLAASARSAKRKRAEDEDDEEEGTERDDDDDDDADDESDDDEDETRSRTTMMTTTTRTRTTRTRSPMTTKMMTRRRTRRRRRGGGGGERVQRAAARTDLPTDFEDVVRTLPKEARAAARLAFRSRLRQMEAGFGRAMTQAREYRKDESKHRAAREFAEAHPVEHIIELLDGDPKLLDKLNKELTDRDKNASHKKLRELEVKAAKKAIEEKAAKEEADLEKRMTRAQHVETFARKLCRKEGIPYEDAVEEALYAAIVSDPNRDISDSDLKNLVAGKPASGTSTWGRRSARSARSG